MEAVYIESDLPHRLIKSLQPATYKRVTEQVLVREETTRFVKVSAVYDQREKCVFH